jgi:pyrroloquinoline quinone biosynthesis protein D
MSAENGNAIIIDAASVVRVARGVRLRDDPARGQTILLAPERAIALDEIAIAIIKALDGKRSLGAIAEDFSRTFEAPREEILTDIVAFVREFANRRMLEIVS